MHSSRGGKMRYLASLNESVKSRKLSETENRLTARRELAVALMAEVTVKQKNMPPWQSENS